MLLLLNFSNSGRYLYIDFSHGILVPHALSFLPPGPPLSIVTVKCVIGNYQCGHYFDSVTFKTKSWDTQ